MSSTIGHSRRQLSLLISSLVLLLSALALGPRPAAAQAGERCFPETGHCISGNIRAYWERNGGLAVFGYPITPLRTETIEGTWAGPVQWFERDRLEDHSADGQGVLAGRLGARFLELRGINWQALPGDSAVDPGCRFFRETQFNLCQPFLGYWERNGGLERFGYPLTRQREEPIEGRTYTVQYFERRRMEHHPEHAGSAHEVQLGLLGSQVYSIEGDQGVVVIPPGDVSAAEQQPALDAAYAALRARFPDTRIAVGLVDLVGDGAVALGRPLGQQPIYVTLARQGATWQATVGGTSAPAGTSAERVALMGPTLAELQRSDSVRNAYVTRPRIAGDYARLWLVPGANEALDPVSAFYKRESGGWRFMTAGSAFPEDQLRAMGVPPELWPYGELVRGPER